MSKILSLNRARYLLLKKYRKYLEPIKRAYLELLPDARLFLFGSALSGDLVAASDIDILILTNKEFKNHMEHAVVVIGIEDRIGLPFVHPFEFHIMTRTKYQRFISTTGAQLEEF
ncbi:MAG: nucleotidyltransferase [Candidatus Gerdarchaeota archaeon]|nr:MAG: nucleotidyltransferase [Candidatus Gerdarchaeota archaeon]